MAAFEIPIQTITRESSADLSDYQYCPMQIDSDGKVALASDGEIIAGVLQDEPSAADRQCKIMTFGVTKGVLGETVAAGAEVEVDSGKFVTQSDGETVGIALEGGDADEQVPILLK